jgi:hypothetical protein
VRVVPAKSQENLRAPASDERAPDIMGRTTTMKLRYVASATKFKLALFAVVLLAGCFVATAARADSLFTGTFELKTEVHWGKAVLAPGVYSLTLDQFPRATPVIIVRDAHTGKTVAHLLSRLGDSTGKGQSKLLVSARGKERAVSSVRLAGFGEVFHVEHPFGASGGAAEEARNVEAISVEVAKK